MSLFHKFPPKDDHVYLSLGIERWIFEAMAAGDEITNDSFSHLVEEGFCLVYPRTQVRERLPQLTEQVMEKIVDMRMAAEKAEGKPSAIRIGRSMGTAFAEWLAGLDGEQSCLYLAEFDVAKAHEYYWFHAASSIKEAVIMKGEYASKNIQTRMEAVLYGMGGKYNGDDGDAAHHDITTPEGREALKACGF